MPAEPPDPGPLVAVRALVAGRVQGVWFRESCRREAAQQGIVGSVRNLTDGRVEIQALGRRTAVEALLAWAHVGPRLAVVESVTIEDLPPSSLAGITSFSVR